MTERQHGSGLDGSRSSAGPVAVVFRRRSTLLSKQRMIMKTKARSGILAPNPLIKGLIYRKERRNTASSGERMKNKTKGGVKGDR